MRWVALLRAVNLGARNKVPMAELRRLLTDAGYGDVRTYIASGNVLLDGPRGRSTVAGELERLIADEFKVNTTAVMRTPKELKERSAEDQREIRWLWRERLYVFSAGSQIFHAWPIVPSLISSRQRQSNMTPVSTVRVNIPIPRIAHAGELIQIANRT